MPNVTVTAADTATAMDEIWDRLGPDAMIVSTKATWQNRHGSHHRVTANRQTSTASAAEFGTLFTNQMIGKAPPGQTNCPASRAWHQMSLPVRRDLAALQDMLTGMVLTDLDGINPALAPSTRVTLQRAGFSQKILQDLQTHYAGYSYSDGCERFCKHWQASLYIPLARPFCKNAYLCCWCVWHWSHNNGCKNCCHVTRPKPKQRNCFGKPEWAKWHRKPSITELWPFVEPANSYAGSLTLSKISTK